MSILNQFVVPTINLDFKLMTHNRNILSGLRAIVSETGATVDFAALRASVKQTENRFGVIEQADTNVPALTFSNGVPNGFLSEEEATNLALKSEELDDAGFWLPARTTIVSNSELNPRGEVGSFLLRETAEDNVKILLIDSSKQPTATSGLPYTGSFYIKKNSGVDIVQVTFNINSHNTGSFANFNIATGVVTKQEGGTANITNEGNGWYRISFTATATDTIATSHRLIFTNNDPNANRQPSYLGSTSNTVLVQFAQFEEGSSASSYIKTEATTATRAKDNVTISDVAIALSTTSGSIQTTSNFPTDYPLIVNGLQATVTGIKTIRFEYTTSEIKLFVDNVLADSATGTYDWSTLNEIQLGHYDGLSQPNFELRDFIVRKA